MSARDRASRTGVGDRSTSREGRVIVADFDGTITERDTLELVVERFGDPDVRRAVEAELGRTLTLNDVLTTIRNAPSIAG